jgi:hypothetical protein
MFTKDQPLIYKRKNYRWNTFTEYPVTCMGFLRNSKEGVRYAVKTSEGTYHSACESNLFTLS